MTKHAARVLLAVCCIVAAAAVVLDFQLSRAHADERSRLLVLERDAGFVVSTLTEMRASQMAYLATGQGPEFWMRRVTDLSGQLADGIAHLRETSTGAEAVANLDTATTALADLMRIDGRVRTALQADQRFLASDLVFAEAVNDTQRIVGAVTAARDAERAATEARLQRETYFRLAVTPLALVVVLLAAYAAGRRQRRPARSAAEEVAQMIRELPPPVKGPVAASASSAATAATNVEPKAAPVPARPPAPAINWTEAAELCVDLARVMDARDMPSLVQRAARTLEASGVIVWVVDTRGETLTPALSHGYSDRVLAKLGTLSVTADNVTSLSYRSMRPQSMPGTGNGASSAIAVPLVTTQGCNGVLAAEIPGSKPAAECIAVARILAAQLATMLSPLDETSARQAAEA